VLKLSESEQLLIQLYQARGKTLVFDLKANTHIHSKSSNTSLERLAMDGFLYTINESTVVNGCEGLHVIVDIEGERLAIDLTQEGVSSAISLHQTYLTYNSITLARRTLWVALAGVAVGVVSLGLTIVMYVR
jgi:hypothetical protein